MNSAGPKLDSTAPDEIPRCTCGSNDWATEHSATGRDRHIRIIRCGRCDQLGVMTSYHERSVIEYDGAVEL